VKVIACAALMFGICLLPGSASASVLEGHAGWFWGNPVPQGNTLRAVAFAGDRGYAVGDFGTVMRSDDGGASWAGITTGTIASLRLVDPIAPDTLIVGGACVLRRSDDAGRSFVSLPWTPSRFACRPELTSLAFPSTDVGYLLLSDGTLLRTRDGGRTWVRRTAVPGTGATNGASGVHATDIKFPGVDVGVAATDSGVLYRTTDGAVSWSPVAGSTQHLDSISFPNPQTGFAVGGASVLKTVDGGATWSQQGVVLPPQSLAWIRCVDALRCVVTTARGDALLRTDDGGSSWTSISPSTLPLYASTYSASGTVVAVGKAGAMVSSQDGGHNFSTISGDLAGRFTQLRAVSADVGYAFGRAGALARTADGGRSWSPLPAPGPLDLVDVSFPTASRGYVLDRQGNLMRTDDGGVSWASLDIGTYVIPRAVLALDPDRLLLVGPRGLRRSVSGGHGFTLIREPLVAKLALSAAATVDGMVYAYGPHAIVVSLDGGQTWSAATLPKRGKTLVKVDFVNRSIAYALKNNGHVWKSRDRGVNWHEVSAVGTKLGTDLAFSDPLHGYLALPEFGDDAHGYVLRTSDGGSTWRPQLVDRGAIHRGALGAPAPLVALAVSGLGHLLATDSGGDVGEHSSLELLVQRRRLTKPGVVAITGQLSPAHGGETVVVSKRQVHDQWLLREVTVSSTGRFTVFALVARTTRFVAQWAGDDTRAGAGSSLVTVAVDEKQQRGRRTKQRKR